MRRVATEARVSRSTLYRHFPSAELVRRGVLKLALAEACADVRAALAEKRPPLALARRAIAALVAVGSRYPIERLGGAGLAGRIEEVGQELWPLAESLRRFTDVEPAPPKEWMREVCNHLAGVCLLAARDGEDPSGVGETLFTAITDPLAQGLLVLEADGGLLALNSLAAEALALDRPKPGERITGPSTEAMYEDGARCPADAYPIARAVATATTQADAVRGHLHPDRPTRWFSVSAIVLRRAADAQTYGILGVFADISDQKRTELGQLPPAGTLGRERPLVLDVARVLDEIPAPLLAEQLVAEAHRLVNVPVGLYVVDIDGTRLLRLAGAEAFPAQLQAPLALGPELAEAGVGDLRARLERDLPGVVMSPMWLRGRAVGVLLALGGQQAVLDEVARQGAPAMELANGYTDVFDARRRRKEINPAAEIQQSLIPPRIARLAGAEVAGGVLPSYEVGGDWFDYVDNRDGAWIAIADAAGRGPHAAALGSVALAALRAARRNDASLEEAVQTVHETVYDAGADEFFLTAVVGRWSPAYSVFSWVNAGHPPPLVISGKGDVEELIGETVPPLGLLDRERSFRRSHRRIDQDEHIVLYTDGISARPTNNGFFGRDGIARAARAAGAVGPTAIARAIQEAVVEASEKPLRDDATLLVLAPRPVNRTTNNH